MQTLSSDEKAVRPSVRPSNAWIVTIRKKGLSKFLYHTKDHLSQFSEKKNGRWGGDSFYLKLWVNWPSFERNRRFSTDFARSSSAVTPSKKVPITLIGSPQRAFQWAQDGHRTLSLSPPPQGWLKTQCPKFEK